MEKLTSTRINTWLSKRGLVTAKKVQTMVNKTVYKPSEFAVKLGIPLGSAFTSFPYVEKLRRMLRPQRCPHSSRRR